MNVIFLDFDGVLDTYRNRTNEQIEEKIKILSDIVKEFNCKVVIEASAKEGIDEDTLEVSGEWLTFLFDYFKKYNIDVIGRTPSIGRRFSKGGFCEIWKEYEILEYLKNHPEIDHFCVIDDDDARFVCGESDLNYFREYLVITLDYAESIEEEGLLPKHKNEVGKILKIENKFKGIHV